MSSAEHHEHVDCVCAYPQLKEKLDGRFALRSLFDEYWHVRRQVESSSPRLARLCTELYAAAVKLCSLVASYQYKTATCTPGSEDDPRTFWSLAQPPNASDSEPGIIDVYVDIMTNDSFLHSPSALIDHILWGFGALFWMGNHWIGIPGRSEKRSVYSLILSYTPRIWKCLWDNRSHIRPRSRSERDAESYGPESVDTLLETYPEPYSRLLEWYSYLSDGYIDFLKDCTPEERTLEPEYTHYKDTFMPHVGLLVWVSGDAQLNVPGKEPAILGPVTSLLVSSDRATAALYTERIAREAIVEGIGAHAFFDWFETVMKQRHADMYKPAPLLCVQLVIHLAMSPSLSPYLADHDVLHPIAQMCNFYGRTKQHWFLESTLMFFMFVTGFVVGPPPDEYKDHVGTTLALVRGDDILDILARGIDCLAEWGPGSNLSGTTNYDYRQQNIGQHLLHYAELIVDTRHKPEAQSPRDRKIVKEMLAYAPSQWSPCLRRLRNAQERGLPCKGLIEDWSLFGAACQLDLAAEGIRIASLGVKLYCSLSRCEYHVSKPPLDMPLKTCTGCGEVKYCSRVCQVQHWKEEHKRRCGNRLHGS